MKQHNEFLGGTLMPGVLIVSHAPLAGALIESSKLILGDELPPCDYLHMELGQDLDEFDKALVKKIDRLNTGSGVLVLTDLLGGSPGNAVAYRMNRSRVELVAGVNLAMVLEALTADEDADLTELKKTVLTAGIEAIVDVGEKMKE